MLALPPLLLLASAVALGTSPQDTLPATLQGEVRSQATGEPLALAGLVLGDGSRMRAAAADSLGRYTLRGVPPGQGILRVTYPGYAPLEVEVWLPPGGVVVVDLALQLRPVTLPPITARARPGQVRVQEDDRAPEPRRGMVSVRAVESTPGLAELGLGSTASTPGPAPVDPGAVLYVRGAATDLKLVLLDGAPVHAPFHMGGLMDAIEPLALGAAELHVGGAPARHHGGLSYVLELESRRPRRDGIRSAGGVDLVGSRALVETPLGRSGGLLVYGRAVHGLGADPFVDAAFPYGYADGLARLDFDVGPGTLSATGFYNHETVQLEEGRLPGSRVAWGNLAASVRYRGEFGSTEAVLGWGTGRFHAEVPAAPGVRGVEGESYRTRLTADLSQPLGAGHLAYGVAAEGYSLESGPAPGSWSGEPARSAAGHVIGAYVEGVAPVADRFQLRGGLRAEAFSGESMPRVGPRLSATWVVSERATMTLAAGRYHQHVRLDAAEPPDGAAAVTAVEDPRLRVAGASHLTLNLEQEVADDLRIGVQGFMKRFDGLALPPQEGTANSSGVDVWLSGGRDRFGGWAGYSLAWVWSPESGDVVTPHFAGRHVLSGGISGELATATRLDVGLVYGAGLPWAAIPRPNPPERERISRQDVAMAAAGPFEADEFDVRGTTDRSYLRVDAGLARTWSPRIGGRSLELTSYVRVLNALDRRDAIFYLRDGGGAKQPVSALPILPVAGFEWRF